MLFSEENVRANIRNREGKRVFYLRQEDTLTPSARDWLTRERIEILPAQVAKPKEYLLENGGFFLEKPENYTHLRGNILVPKTHPVIAFRGAVDTMEAELLLAQQAVPQKFRSDVGEILQLARDLIRWDVLEEPAKLDKLLGLTEAELRAHSHDPQKYYGIPHFMPSCTDSAAILQLNRARCAARSAELAVAAAYPDRQDLLRAANRLSSALYILMIQLKAQS
jgi:ethanolamine utilization cobalamin adenosyltransferase